ncbi:hypothetical protein NOC27_2803 [Nitrosococcus oceani AFC27]|nr:hypothetical protein NOC27_2803 [Nitrosococcus oceani AFC27]
MSHCEKVADFVTDSQLFISRLLYSHPNCLICAARCRLLWSVIKAAQFPN